jgi:Protein of unknown function (DUF3533)
LIAYCSAISNLLCHTIADIETPSVDPPLTTDELSDPKSIPVTDPKNSDEINPTVESKQSNAVSNALFTTLKIGIIGEIVVIVMMFAISNIVYGTAWNTVPYTRKYMKVAVWLPQSSLNGTIETAVSYVVDNHLSYGLNYKFVFVSSDEVSLSDLRDSVDYGRYYGAFAVPEGASQQLESYLSGSSSTKPSCLYYYDQARDGPSFQFALGSLGSAIIVNSNIYLTETTLTAIANQSSSLTVSPVSKLVQPVSVSTHNLHEVDRYGLFIVSGSGSLQMYLVMLCHSLGLAPLTASLQGHGIKRYQLTQLSAFHRIFGALYLSIYPMIVTLILGSGNSHIVHSSAVSSF